VVVTAFSIVIIGDDDGFEMEGAVEVVSSVVIIGDDIGEDDGGVDGAAVGDATGFVLRHSVNTDRDSEGDEVGEDDDAVCFHLTFSFFRVRVIISPSFVFATGSCCDAPLFLVVVVVLPR